MNVKSEFGDVINKVPKLFSTDYSCYINNFQKISSNEKIKSPNGLRDRFLNSPIGERLFCYLKEGLEEGEDTYIKRRLEIENLDKNIFKKPLLSIFTHSDFKAATTKTPELYFDVYKKIIGIKMSKLKENDLSLTNKQKLDTLMSSMSLEEHDCIYMKFCFESTDILKTMQMLTVRTHPLFDTLLDSDLTSHFVDHIFQLKDIKSVEFIDRLIITQRLSALNYICTFEFENGVKALEWFFAYNYFKMNQTKEAYLNIISIKTKKFKDAIFSCDISKPEIRDMFSKNITHLSQVEKSEKVEEVFNCEMKETLTVAEPTFIDFSTSSYEFTENPSQTLGHDTLKRKFLAPEPKYSKTENELDVEYNPFDAVFDSDASKKVIVSSPEKKKVTKYTDSSSPKLSQSMFFNYFLEEHFSSANDDDIFKKYQTIPTDCIDVKKIEEKTVSSLEKNPSNLSVGDNSEFDENILTQEELDKYFFNENYTL